MKLLKWLFGSLAVLVLVIGVGVAALVYLVDWNDFKDTIQDQVKKQTGRELTITGRSKPFSVPVGRYHDWRDQPRQRKGFWRSAIRPYGRC